MMKRSGRPFLMILVRRWRPVIPVTVNVLRVNLKLLKNSQSRRQRFCLKVPGIGMLLLMKPIPFFVGKLRQGMKIMNLIIVLRRGKWRPPRKIVLLFRNRPRITIVVRLVNPRWRSGLVIKTVLWLPQRFVLLTLRTLKGERPVRRVVIQTLLKTFGKILYRR